MAASGGSTGRAGSGSRSFDFGSDDVLCSYDDFAPQEQAPKRPDHAVKDFHESRTGRPLVNVSGQHEVYPKEEVLSAVEKCMKKYADNLLLFLEGISGRLSQLELYCYKLERSIGDLRADMVRDQSEKDVQLKSLEKHLQEVHRSVQILRDKQELADTQKELAKFQLVQKEPNTSQKSDERVATPPVSEPKRQDETPDIPNQHLALVPRQTCAPPPLPAIGSEQHQSYKELPMQHPTPASVNMPHDHYLVNQPSSFYAQRPPLPQEQQSRPVQLELQYVQARPQFQDPVLPQQQQAFTQYQQQWSQAPPQQFPQQAVQPQQPPQPQARPQTPPTYPSYPPHQPTHPIAETYPGSMPMQGPYSTIQQPGGSRADTIPFGYGGPGSAASAASQPPHHQNIQRQPQPQGSQSSSGPPLSKSGYAGAAAPYPPQPNLQGYNTMYNGMDGSRIAPSQNFQPGSYPQSNMPALQNQHRPQPMRDHSYVEMIEKAVSMGYPRDHVVGVIHRMAEAGMPFDFNGLLDRLNGPSAGASPRGWSG